MYRLRGEAADIKDDLTFPERRKGYALTRLVMVSNRVIDFNAASQAGGVSVVHDAYGATEGGVAVNRDVAERAGALGQVGDNVQVVDEDGREKARARFDAGTS